MALDSHLFLSYTVSTMKVGDLVTMDTPLTPERYGVGLIQKIVQTNDYFQSKSIPRNVYLVRWNDGGVSNQYDNEIVLVSKV